MITESRLAWDRFNEELTKMENSGFSSTQRTTSNNTNLPKARKEESSFSSSSCMEHSSGCGLGKDEDDTSKWFSPMKLMRFPSLFGDDKKAKEMFHKEDQVIKVKKVHIQSCGCA